MSKDVGEFIDAWISEHVRATASADDVSEAHRLADTLVDDADKEGISKADLEKEIGGTILQCMKDALKDARHKDDGDDD